VPTVPAGLEGPVADALERFSARIQATADSLRQAHALPVELPEEWLGGYYLANAGEFPEIRQFWVRYESLIQALRERDRPVFEAVMAEVAGAADLLDRNALAAYLTGRYEAAVSSRQDRYDQLVLASNRAIQFHDFLVLNQEEFLFTPALGSAIPRDPVLEIGTATPALRAELNRRLDELLSALDRSRGGALPSSAGLARELLSGFGEL
jgi:hypothetical protein